MDFYEATAQLVRLGFEEDTATDQLWYAKGRGKSVEEAFAFLVEFVEREIADHDLERRMGHGVALENCCGRCRTRYGVPAAPAAPAPAPARDLDAVAAKVYEDLDAILRRHETVTAQHSRHTDLTEYGPDSVDASCDLCVDIVLHEEFRGNGSRVPAAAECCDACRSWFVDLAPVAMLAEEEDIAREMREDALRVAREESRGYTGDDAAPAWI